MPSRPFRSQDIAFFGATTASVSHELKNVVTIINETAGLLHDLTLGAERGRPLDVKRVRKISTDISNNVTRAVDILNRLNRFAHSADEPVHTFDLSRMLGDVMALSERAASGRGMSLRAELPEGPVWVTGYPFGVHQLIGLALRMAIQANEEPVEITLRLAKAVASDAPAGGGPGPAGGPGPRVTVAPVPASSAKAVGEAWELAETLAQDLGVAISKGAVDDGAPGLHIEMTEQAAAEGAQAPATGGS